MHIRGYWTRTSAIISASKHHHHHHSSEVYAVSSDVYPTHHVSSDVYPTYPVSSDVYPTYAVSSDVYPTDPASSDVYPASSAAYPASSGVYSVSSNVYPTYAESASYSVVPSPTEIPSNTSTSALTTTTTTESYPDNSIFGPIEGLSQCAQGIIFPCLSDSKCDATDFPCICDELKRLDIRESVATTCTPAELDQYDTFVANTCQANYRADNITSSAYDVVYPTTTIGTPYPVYTTPVPHQDNYTNSGIPYSTGYPVPVTTYEILIPTTGPGGEVTTITTTIVRPAGPIPTSELYTVPYSTGYPVSLTTPEVLIPTTGANGEPTTITSKIVEPVGPTSTSEPFTGAAAAVLDIGSVRAGILAAAMGVMGIVFAEL